MERTETALALARSGLEPLVRSRLVANLSALTASVIFGASVVATRAAVKQVPPFTLGFLRFAIGGLILTALLFLGRRRRPALRATEWGLLAVLGATLFGLFPLLFNAGLRLTEASRGAVMLATVPLMSLALARRLRHEQLTPRQVAGVVGTSVGIVLIFAEAGSMKRLALPVIGDALLLACAALAAVYGVLAKRVVVSRGPLLVTAYAMLFGSILQLPFAAQEIWRSGLPRFTSEAAGLTGFLALVGGAAAYFLWTAALTRLRATELAVYINVNPVVAAVLAALLLGEGLTAIYVAAVVWVLGGVVLVNWPARPSPGLDLTSADRQTLEGSR
jgi:drug/metabolite transporter (DMT)-like permease